MTRTFGSITLLCGLLVIGFGASRAMATTWYVATNGNDGAAGTDWATAKATIQAAINAAGTGDTVLVSNGVYQTGGQTVPPSLLTNRVVIDKPLTVQSLNGPDVTTIRGNKPNGDAAVRCVWMTSNGTALIGFTLTNGGTRTIGVNTEVSGGGLLALAASAVVSNCVLTGNGSSSSGGGAHQGTLNNCRLTGNTSTSGGGVNQGFLNNCLLTQNVGLNGGGAYFSTLSNCVLILNGASTGGGGAAFGWLYNCVLYLNAGSQGGGAWFVAMANNCTIIANNASQGGGARSSTLNNCIVYSNTGSTSNNHYSCALTNCCTTPLPAGVGNFTNAPQFVDVANTNFHLTASSPCRDTGNNTFAPGSTDLGGLPRIVHPVVDMGAFEYQDPPPADYDGDGLLSWWETVNGLQPVVSNAVDSNADADGMTDLEEYIADTHPTNGASFFPAVALTNASPGTMTLVVSLTSTGRVYGAFANTNLLDTPQAWTLLTPEQTGTASTLQFSVTNNLPAQHYRTGVRLP